MELQDEYIDYKGIMKKLPNLYSYRLIEDIIKLLLYIDWCCYVVLEFHYKVMSKYCILIASKSDKIYIAIFKVFIILGIDFNVILNIINQIIY